ncbi:MAG: DinB family protein [Saprospiraceae bacterium]|nr:DinB family protein [Saprospiraceae bacterium]
MKKEARNTLLDRLETELDRQINLVVDQFQNLDDSLLNKQSEGGGWSVAQNLEHLNFYFNYYNPAIKRALQKAIEDKNANTFHSGWLGSYFSKSMDYRTNKKVKAFSDYIPQEQLDSARVIQDFIQNEEDLLQLIRKAKNYNLTKIRLPISLSKWITMRLGDVFQFVLLHNERHLVQAQSRLERKDGIEATQK